jgi:hypothetical protein
MSSRIQRLKFGSPRLYITDLMSPLSKAGLSLVFEGEADGSQLPGDRRVHRS